MSANPISRLNPEQKQAVKSISGPVLVLAGAGSGKTGVITNKIVYLIRECGYRANHVVALTFTNKAASEMKERVNKMLRPEERKGLWVSTFHTLGLRILKEDGHYMGLTRDFSIFDGKDSLEIIKEIVKIADEKELRTLQSTISNLKNDIGKQTEYDDAVHVAAKIYNEHLLALNSVDFDDLIIHCINLFNDHPEVLKKWQKRIRYLLLDEYQDTNQSQYELVKHLANESGHFTAVGDDDQSIYSWRGAEAENLKRLSEDFPTLEVVKLEQNYRCDKRILSSANALIANNTHIFEKKLWSTIENGESIRINAYNTDADEGLAVVGDIAMHNSRHGTNLSDYAILYRGNFQSRVIEKALRQQQLPYVINGSTSFFEHTEVRDLLAYLRVIANPNDQRAFVRIVNTPKREVGTTTVQKLSEYARNRHISLLDACLEYGLSQVMPEKAQARLYEFGTWLMGLHKKAEQGESPLQIFDWVMGDIDYEEYVRAQHTDPKADKRMELVTELRDWISRLNDKDDLNNLAEIIQRMLLLDMLENKAEDEKAAEAISLMTLHAAKGLEFPFVFIVGLEDGLLPHANSSATEEGVEEERRLLYVGMTRAKRRLSMSLARNRRVGGTVTPTDPSRFIDELPKDEIEWSGINEKVLSKEQKDAQRDNVMADIFAMLGDDV